MEELWRIVEEARNYEVSNQGRVRNRKTGRILKTTPNSNGRPHVVLMDRHFRVGRNVSKLVERAFGS
jgi:hypothetical protein